MAKKKVADLLVDVLAEAGVKQIYGVSGDSLNRQARICSNSFHVARRSFPGQGRLSGCSVQPFHGIEELLTVRLQACSSQT